MEDDYGEEALETLIVYSFNVWKSLIVCWSNPDSAENPSIRSYSNFPRWNRSGFIIRPFIFLTFFCLTVNTNVGLCWSTVERL